MKNLIEGAVQDLHDIKEVIDNTGEKIDGSVELSVDTMRQSYYAIDKAEAMLFALAYGKIYLRQTSQQERK